MRWAVALTVALALVSTLAPAGLALAQYGGGATKAPLAPIQPQEGGERDNEPDANLPYLFAVYIITWAGFFGYVFVMSRRQREMHRDLETLRMVLAEKERSENEGDRAPA